MSKKNKSFTENMKESVKRSRSVRRKVHFEDGRSLSEWNPGRKVHKNKADKRETRRTRREKAIQDSQD